MDTPMSTDPRGGSFELDAKVVASVRKILLACGALESDLDDLCQRVRLAVHQSENVPASEPERTQYIHGVARNVARKERARVGAAGPHLPLDDEEGLAAVGPPALEAIDLARKLHAEAVAHDPQGAEWLVRAKVYGDTTEGIASADGVPAARVRQRISRLVLRMRKHSIALAGVAAAFAVALLLFLDRDRDGDRNVGSMRPDLEKPTPAHHPMVNEQEATAMRKAALKACDDRQWKACLDGLDRARVIDPAGDAHEDVQAARKVAQAEIARTGTGSK